MGSEDSVSVKLKVHQKKYNRRYPEVGERKYLSFSRKIKVDRNSLDEIIERQSVMFQSISEKAASATSIRDAIKDDLDELEGKLAFKYRKDFVAKSAKVTDKQVTEAVRWDSKYQKAALELNVAKNMALRWTLLKNSFEQRAAMIKLLAQLFVANYYTTSSVSGESREEREVVTQGNRSRIRKSSRKIV